MTTATTEQHNAARLTKHRRSLPPEGIDRILRNGEVQRRFVQYSTNGRGQIEPKMPENLALEAAIQDVCGDPNTSGGRHFAYICEPANIRRLKKYAAGDRSAAPQLELGDEASVRATLRSTKDPAKISAMLTAEYQGRNEDALPRQDIIDLILTRLSSVREHAEAKASVVAASDDEVSAALEE